MITRDCRGGVGVNGAWEGPACVPAVNTRLLVAERGRQMGRGEKRISAPSDIRRSLRPIRGAQEVASD